MTFVISVFLHLCFLWEVEKNNILELNPIRLKLETISWSSELVRCHCFFSDVLWEMVDGKREKLKKERRK